MRESAPATGGPAPRPSLQERIQGIQRRHGGAAGPESTEPAADAPVPTDDEALATLQATFPGATVETVPENV